ncbi:60 kDa neurofilament protein-like [Octopus sinensis]|uniref:60 kDa neurofilament protein-like n=1 Tax=Octopus sinensis TaxID=2607531 RepID=A0A6P7TVR3_9MOLL|nr:60 kDa neurofilament protein-like [Octopus sinensis]
MREGLIRNDIQNKCQSLNEQLEFSKDIHEQVGKCFSRKQELKDLRALANDDQFAQSKEWWNVEFSNCIKEIQSEYENRLESIRLEMESSLENFNQQFIENATYSNSQNVLERQISYQRNEKGPISIVDVNSEGLFISIENTNEYKV